MLLTSKYLSRVTRAARTSLPPTPAILVLLIILSETSLPQRSCYPEKQTIISRSKRLVNESPDGVFPQKRRLNARKVVYQCSGSRAS